MALGYGRSPRETDGQVDVGDDYERPFTVAAKSDMQCR
jgi:hypothetical protein